LEIDRWILLRLHKLIEKVIKAYDNFEFHVVYHSLYDFCVNDLSAFYLDMSKDRLYCGGKESVERRSAQFAMNEILNALVRLMAPILSFTAEDILKHIITNDELRMANEGSIFLYGMPKPDAKYLDEKLEAKWETVFQIREKVYKKIEALRATKEIGAAIDAQVEILANGNEFAVLKSIEAILPMVFIVSKVILTEGEGEPKVSHAPGAKCPRCWLWNEKTDPLCPRCSAVVAQLQL
jgi:isoleucyl-tRNA synthetase